VTGEPRGPEYLLTPSKITAWLDCAHYLTLKHQVEAGTRDTPGQPFGSFARLLQDKGLEHEAAVLARYVADGLNVLEVEDRQRAEPFADWAARSLSSLDGDADLVFQMPFVHDGVRGIADFVERRIDPAPGETTWEPVDAKLVRSAAKPSHILQLCFYAEAIASLTGKVPDDLKVALGSGDTDVVGYEDVRPYWARLRVQLQELLAREPGADGTAPEPCDHCEFCEFQTTCEQTWRDADSLIYVAGITKKERAALDAAQVDTLAALAEWTEPVAGLRPERLVRLRQQAALQVQARAEPGATPPFVLTDPGDDPVWGHGFEQLPEPDAGDIFLDFEGHPFWRADRGLFFLFGFVAADEDGDWRFHGLWAHDEYEERDRVAELVRYIEDRRARHPGMHVYHYNHTERSALESLVAQHAVAESALAALVESGAFVDLFMVARNAMQVGVESYGLKHLERLTDYERSHEIDRGAGAVVAFEEHSRDGDQAHLDAIAAYNEDDVRATQALRDWLVAQRPVDLAWRAASVEPEEEPADVDELIEALAAFEDDTVERLLADLLGYWLREWRAFIAPKIGHLSAGADEQLDNPAVLAGLGHGEEVDRLTPTGRPAKWPGLRMAFPPQTLGSDFEGGRVDSAISLGSDGLLGFVDIDETDVDGGTVTLVWSDTAQEHGPPSALVVNDWVSPSTKRGALEDLARQVLDPAAHGTPNPVTMALLGGDPPTFRDGGGPAGGHFGDDPGDLARWATELDHGVLAIQGPPGTGKTYRGAHMVKALIGAGRRVGVMAMSHHAIDNFLTEIVAVCAQEPAVEVRAGRRRDEPDGGGLLGVTYGANLALDRPEFNVVCGTAWQFAGTKLREAPVDALLIDEAGQLALVDAVVASMAADSVVLLGDPQQLPQVAQATHPGGSGASALGHMLGDDETMPDARGVFIHETRRMHPDVCRFISERIYQGRLASHADCTVQGTELGTGLRWIEVDHEGCSTESGEEAEVVAAQIEAMLGRTWTDKNGATQVIGVGDVMVVAPYNDQVRLLRERLDSSALTRGIPVGTVDKFQGRQAPIVFFTMTSSSAEDMPRGSDFLFSRNRLNVAVSRAQCLAYLVCTEQLLRSRAKTVEEMHLIATLCAFVEYANPTA